MDREDTGVYKDRFFIVARRRGEGWEKFGLYDNTHIEPDDLELVLEALRRLNERNGMVLL